jgi:hypothetical protein
MNLYPVDSAVTFICLLFANEPEVARAPVLPPQTIRRLLRPRVARRRTAWISTHFSHRAVDLTLRTRYDRVTNKIANGVRVCEPLFIPRPTELQAIRSSHLLASLHCRFLPCALSSRLDWCRNRTSRDGHSWRLAMLPRGSVSNLPTTPNEGERVNDRLPRRLWRLK